MQHLSQQSCPSPTFPFISLMALLCLLLSISADATVAPTDSNAIVMIGNSKNFEYVESETCFAEAKFTIAQTICTGKIQVQNKSTGANSFEWVYKGKMISKAFSPEISINDFDGFELKLRASDGNCSRQVSLLEEDLLLDESKFCADVSNKVIQEMVITGNKPIVKSTIIPLVAPKPMMVAEIRVTHQFDENVQQFDRLANDLPLIDGFTTGNIDLSSVDDGIVRVTWRSVEAGGTFVTGSLYSLAFSQKQVSNGNTNLQANIQATSSIGTETAISTQGFLVDGSGTEINIIQ